MNYRSFFKHLTGRDPYPYQERLGEAEHLPEVICVPTGLGKTAAVVVAWLNQRRVRPQTAPRRLVYCLPMRVLVEQVVANVQAWLEAAAPFFVEGVPEVHILMGGSEDHSWMGHPERPALLVGTQDMLVSAALNRGYSMSRYRWPQAFGLLNSDCQWVLDETQLMGPALPTSAQLQGFRRQLGTLGAARTTWMSATLDESSLDTVDHPGPPQGREGIVLEARDRQVASQLLQAPKPLVRAPLRLDRENVKKDYARYLATHLAQAHLPGTRTLVILNSVGRAQALCEALEGLGMEPVLLHSRFRAPDRAAQQARLARPDALVVSTQVIEAGVDLSSRLLVTELAPWSSLVQRFGRCNRYGEQADPRIEWIDVDLDEGRPNLALPYEASRLEAARSRLEGLQDVGLQSLERVPAVLDADLHPVLRRKDLLDLFDTSADLSGDDLDVSIYVRGTDEADVQVYWRQGPPGQDEPGPTRDEILNLPVGSLAAFLKKARPGWVWNPLHKDWEPVSEQGRRLRPGMTVRLAAEAGGYLPDRGWVGDRSTKAVQEFRQPLPPGEAMDGDPEAEVGHWIPLHAHLDHVLAEAQRLVESFQLPAELAEAVVTAARWHDVGKSHPAFQGALVPLAPPAEQALWAKSARGTGRLNYAVEGHPRPGFRHELASALAWIATREPSPQANLVAWLIAGHHGKVRLSLRALPLERAPDEPDRLFARGVWDGEALPALPGLLAEPVRLDLSLMQLGPGSWTERMLALRDAEDLGPFRLAALEALVRAADGRASAKERER